MVVGQILSKINKNKQKSMIGGQVILKSVELRLETFENEFPGPICLSSGLISELQIKIPWTSLTTQPVEININTIEIVISPRTDFTKPRVFKRASISSEEGLLFQKRSLRLATIISFFPGLKIF